MNGAGVNVEGKRRFPSWMLGTAAADQLRKSGNGAANSNPGDGSVLKVHQPVLKSGTTRNVKDFLLHEKESVKMTSRTLAKCKRKRRKIESSQQDAHSDSDISKSGSIVKKSTPRKRQKTKNLGCVSSEESEILTQGDSDVELTVEDLMSIAEEYVRADMGAEQQSLSNGDCELESQLQPTASSRDGSRSSFVGRRSNRGLPTDETATCSYILSENLASEGDVISSTRTGDPAQDMLNLFLGPLLNRPVPAEYKAEFITEDMTFVSEIKNQSQSASVGEESAPLMKKKSSLKDKVAMFFD